MYAAQTQSVRQALLCMSTNFIEWKERTNRRNILKELFCILGSLGKNQMMLCSISLQNSVFNQYLNFVFTQLPSKFLISMFMFITELEC